MRLLDQTVMHVFGFDGFASAMGCIQSLVIIPGLAGPVLTGVLHDATGSYGVAFALVVSHMMIAGRVALWDKSARIIVRAGGAVRGGERLDRGGGRAAQGGRARAGGRGGGGRDASAVRVALLAGSTDRLAVSKLPTAGASFSSA